MTVEIKFTVCDLISSRLQIKKSVRVYNEIRPHCSLKGLTPFEVLEGLRPDNPMHLKSVNLIDNNMSNIEKIGTTCTVCNE